MVRDGLDPVGAVDAQRRRWDDDTADLVVLDPLEHAPLVHVPVPMASSTSRTGASGMRCRLAIANASILSSVRVHAVTSASVASRLATRAALSAKRGSSRRSSRPIALSRLCQCSSTAMFKLPRVVDRGSLK
jgi:hypothetical protein